MGWKTRGSYKSFCLRKCGNKNIKCNVCYMFSEYQPVEEVENGSVCNKEGHREHNIGV